MADTVRAITKCRVCGSTHLQPMFSLGTQALTGVFPRPDQPDPLAVPLDLLLCSECKFLQLKFTVDPDLMYAEYWYRSGINQTMRDHLAGVTADIRRQVQLAAGDTVIDIGCNDGTLLSTYQIPGLKRIGVDPSNAILSIADPTVTKVNTFFSAAAVQAALGGAKAKAISSISMFYDLDDPHAFVESIKACLHPDGIWIVEMNYTGNMILSLGYDMICQEHVAYYTLRTFEHLLQLHGMHVNDANFNSINGGSIRLFCGFQNRPSAAVARIRDQEQRDGLEDLVTYADYARRIEEFRIKLTGLVRSLRAQGKRLAVYGASTRGNTILQHCGFTRDDFFAAADRNPGKWGLTTPTSRIPIQSEDDVRAAKPDYMLVLPYGFLEEFLKREEPYMKAGGKLIVPLPEMCVYGWDAARGLVRETV